MSLRQNNKVILFFFGVTLFSITWFSTARPESGKRFLRFRTQQFFAADSSDGDTLDKRKYKASKKPTFKDKDRYGDEFSNSPQKESPLTLPRPRGVKTEVKIDESGEYYTVDEKLNGVDYRPGTTMTFDQYKQYQKKQVTKNYYRGKSKALDEKAAAKNDKPRALVPRIYINPNLDRIFGGNYIDVKLNGSVLLDFGYRIQTTNNPAIPVNQRSIGGFFFDQQIAMNAQAKIGERLKLTINQDTKSQFDFDNNIKIEYSALETDIIQKIEAGNISMPINSSLIQGANNLFGVKATMKFGRLTATAVAANQRGKREETKVNGGAMAKDFQIRADNYEDNKHYFLSHFFRNNYEPSLGTMPQINSGVKITRVEVWITNRNNTTDALRNVAAFMDLGESDPYNKIDIQSKRIRNNVADNKANTLYEALVNNQGDSTNGLRKADNTSTLLSGAPFNLENGNDYEIIRGARKLRDTEYKFHPDLGYISLNAAVGRDDVIGVAYEYSYRGTRYQVGELPDDYLKLSDKQIVFLKLLRPSTIRTNVPMWDLQMKNIYSLQSTNISRENFQLRVVYRDDKTQLNNPVLTNTPGSLIDGKPLLQIMELDRLNMSNDPQPDGNFDYVESGIASAVQVTNPIQNQNSQSTTNANDPTQSLGNQQNNINNSNAIQQNRISAITIDPQAGRIIFPVLEPFGQTLKQSFGRDSIERPELIQKYVYDELYRRTKSDALQLSNKNKFFIVGRMQSTASDEIQLQTFGSLSPGSVRVNAGSALLTEGTDYTVDYNLGKVKIINPAYLLPGQEIRVSVEKQDLFQVRTKSFYGTRLDYILNKDIAFGGTFLTLNERPLISRVAIGDEPVNNTVWGLDGTFKKDSRLITTALDKLPFYATKEKSTFQATGEFAQLFSSTPALTNKDGGTFYIDDFENTQIPFRLDNSPALNWRLASTPPGLEGDGYSLSNPLALSARRAKLAWYIIDPLFYRDNLPQGITAKDMLNNYTRAVLPQAIFPGRDRQQIQLNEPLFDLAYFPSERGPYNYNANDLDANGNLRNPERNWAGITRAVNNYDTDFDNANYQYLEFWMMDPFLPGENGKVITGSNQGINNTSGGKLIFNLGSISEDVLRDSKQEFEQGLPANGQKPGPLVDASPWGYVTSQQYLTNAFTNEPGARQNQDLGLDGLNNTEEATYFGNFINRINNHPVLSPEAKQKIKDDPSADDFKYFLGTDLNNASAKVVERYKSFNGQQGNSPDNSANTSGSNPSSYTTPDNEDINQNNTLNDIEEFFKYELDLAPGKLTVGQNHIVNTIQESVPETGEKVNWYLVRIPLREGYEKYGNIQNFKSIRFLRTVLTGWTQPVVLRMAQMQLVASQWRPYTGDLTNKGLGEVIEPDDKVFTVSTVSIEENKNPNPDISPNTSPYVVPPGFQRDRDVNSTVARQLNEHSLRLCVTDLPDQDARAVFKNVGGLSLINYSNVKMFVHAEADPNYTKDDDLTIFMRFGSDFTDNYYEIEIPLKLTNPAYTFDPNQIWKSENEFSIVLEDLVDVKLRRDRDQPGDLFSIFTIDDKFGPLKNQKIYVRGNPQYTNIQTIMIGIRNTKSPDRSPKSVCLWADELRIAGVKNDAGWAATGRVSMKLADLGNVTGTFKYTTAGFGGLEQKISQRLQENTLEYGMNANLAIDKLLPLNNKIGLKLPMYASYDKKNISPRYDPTNPDVPTEKSLINKEEIQKANPTSIEPVSRQAYANIIEDNTVRRSISFNNIQKVKVKPGAKQHIYDIENISVTLGYSDTRRSNVSIQSYDSKNYKAGAGYNYAPKVPSIEPFKNVGGFLKSPYLKLIKDVNLTPFPNNLSVRGDLDRTITSTQYSNGIINGRQDITGIAPTYEKRFLFNRNYALGWTITKSLAFNYNASVNAIVDEPAGAIDNSKPYYISPTGEKVYTNRTKRDSIEYNLQNGGRIKTFNQQMGLNYKLPLDKFPAVNWLNADARYASGYTWNAGAVGISDSLGNTAQNTRDITLNGRADFTKLYNKIKFLSAINNPTSKPPPPPPNLKDTSKKKEKPKPEFQGIKSTLRLLMMLRSVNVTYQRTQGTVLPGYLGKPKYFGLDESLNNGTLYDGFIPFILGDQNQNTFKNEKFADKYMSRAQSLSNYINQNQTENITGRANIEPFKDFRIQLDAKITNSMSYQELYRYDTDTLTGQSAFHTHNPYRTGSYSVSFIAVETFFEPGGGIEKASPTFTQFEENLSVITNRLNKRNPDANKHYIDTIQDVMIPAFIAAYSRKSPNKISTNTFPMIPLPNWRIDYAGLPNVLPGIKKFFPSINITHSYSATYSVNSYSTSLKYGGDTVNINSFRNTYYPTIADTQGVYLPINIIGQVSIIERFAPLLGINLKTKNNMTFRMEYRTDRNLTLNMSNRQLTETRTNDFTFGYGFTKANMKLPMKYQGREIVLKNDVTFRVDITRRESTTVQRKIDGLGTITLGQVSFQIRPNASYQINQRLTTQAYFEYTLNQPKVSNSFTRTTFAFGIQFRYSLS